MIIAFGAPARWPLCHCSLTLKRCTQFLLYNKLVWKEHRGGIHQPFKCHQIIFIYFGYVAGWHPYKRYNIQHLEPKFSKSVFENICRKRWLETKKLCAHKPSFWGSFFLPGHCPGFYDPGNSPTRIHVVKCKKIWRYAFSTFVSVKKVSWLRRILNLL